jgi:ribosomal protein S12 methylthiotransferase accessory factor
METSKKITVTFGENKRVRCDVDGFVIETDQSVDHGGDGSAPEPFTIFLASVGACAGAYVVGFCAARNISTDGVSLTQACEFDSEGKLREINLVLTLPETFPTMYLNAVRAAVSACKVKKVLADPPNVSVDVSLTRRHHEATD